LLTADSGLLTADSGWLIRDWMADCRFELTIDNRQWNRESSIVNAIANRQSSMQSSISNQQSIIFNLQSAVKGYL
jgi:hypothetical protein